MNRSSGVLLHITSLPGGEGVGDLGVSAYAFVDWLVVAGQRWWQVLPCGEVGYGESPYQSRSAYAGNPLLLSLRSLVETDLLDDDFYTNSAAVNTAVDFAEVRRLKEGALQSVCEQFHGRANAELQRNFAAYVASPEQHWLHDYARFVVLKQRFDDLPWTSWSDEFASRDESSLAAFDAIESSSLEAVKIQQFLFARQWQALRDYANSCSVSFLGDCPIYVAADSADVWCHPELFDLRPDGTPRVVAGVPPDYFSATGQLWGNPLYLWEHARADDFAWWRARIKHCATQFDLTRVDHFRGLDAYWEVPADAPDASSGEWQDAPGADLLNAIASDFESLPLVAEDLGDLTASVHELRERFELPGMRVLQFGFDGGDDNPHAPDRITDDVICYAGTHDNNTTLGWINEIESERFDSLCERYSCSSDVELLDAVLDDVSASPAQLAIFTMQDLLQLDATARFNTPGTVGENWRWRMRPEDLSQSLALELAQRSERTKRCEHRNTTKPIFSLTTIAADKTSGGQPKALEG